MDVKLTWLDTGYCRQLELFSRKGGRVKMIRFHALVGLIEHPQHGIWLFDTGYSPRFFQATQSFPYSLYASLTPVVTAPEQSVLAQLNQRGIAADEVKGILLSHFHADHIGGLRDFPKARLYCYESAYLHVKDKTGIAAVREAYLPDLMPADFAERVTFVDRLAPVELPARYAPYAKGYDLFGDQSAWVVDLPGHAQGQFGVFVRDRDHGELFLCADAAWSSEAYRRFLLPHPLARLIMSDRKAYRDELHKLHILSRNRADDLRIMPTHCSEVWETTKEGGDFSWRS